MYIEISNTGSFKPTQPTAFRYFVISKFNLYFNVKTDEILSAPSPTRYLSPAVLPIAFDTRKPFSWGPTAHLRIDVWGPPPPSTWWPPYHMDLFKLVHINTPPISLWTDRLSDRHDENITFRQTTSAHGQNYFRLRRSPRSQPLCFLPFNRNGVHLEALLYGACLFTLTVMVLH